MRTLKTNTMFLTKPTCMKLDPVFPKVTVLRFLTSVKISPGELV